MSGYRVVSARSGQQARALVASRAVGGVLLDYRLPDTIGLELCQELRATLGPDVPILLVTADRDPMLENWHTQPVQPRSSSSPSCLTNC